MKRHKSNMPIYEAVATGQVYGTNPDALGLVTPIGKFVSIDATSIVQAYRAFKSGGASIKTITDVAPAYEHLWIEWNDEAKRDKLAAGIVAICGEERIAELQSRTTSTDFNDFTFPADTKWLLFIAVFAVSPMSGRCCVAPVLMVQPINGEGSPANETQYLGKNGWDNDPDWKMKAATVMSVSSFALFALSLMNCRNIGHVEHEGVALRKRQGRKPQKWKYTYRTLTIKPMGAAKSGASHDGETTDHNAMHFCRGNFATYSEEKPLFGKYVGKFWRPAHLKGKATVGVVDKDYAIQTEAPQ